jgi:hypothetical protein
MSADTSKMNDREFREFAEPVLREIKQELHDLRLDMQESSSSTVRSARSVSSPNEAS